MTNKPIGARLIGAARRCLNFLVFGTLIVFFGLIFPVGIAVTFFTDEHERLFVIGFYYGLVIGLMLIMIWVAREMRGDP